MQEEELLKSRLQDLASRAYEHNQYTFSDFLNAMELSVFMSEAKRLSFVPFQLYGGYEGSERQMIRFGSEEMLGYEMPFPIQCILIEPLIKKFADEFSHRDFLGALMNLGIERSMIGDIVLHDQSAYVFCTEKMSAYMMEQVDQVKHTHMKCRMVEELPAEIFHAFEVLHVIVSSERIDGIIAKLLHMSRSQVIRLFQEKKIFVNSRLCENNNQLLKINDTVSVRGYGKMIYEGIQYQTKKDKLNVQIRKYL
ncbi:MAG: YlmH/Sll1252 family protein [Lachnospiraceae bacterium]|nr:YlmH/Sll1252 family protein [Lachnospiraceae bacterium]